MTNRSHAVARAATRSSTSLFDSLEARRLLTTLVVTGTPVADDIRIAVSGGFINVTLNGVTVPYADSVYDSISVTGGNGADQIYLESNGANPTTISGDAGADTVYLGGIGHSMDGINAAVVANSSDGVDTLKLDDGATNGSDGYNILADGTIQRGGGFGGVQQTGFADVSIDAGPLIDVFYVYGTPTTGEYDLLGGSGDDGFVVNTTNGAKVVIDAGSGSSDLLDINQDGGDPATATIVSTQVLDSVNLYSGGTLALQGTAGVVFNTNLSTLDGAITLDQGFIIERNSEASDGAGYYRERLRIGKETPTAEPRITSPFANASPISDSIGYGYKENIVPTSYGGFALNTGDLLVRYTTSGDTNLDGTTDFTDLLALAKNYNTTGKKWYQGDLDYNGTVDFSDLLLLAKAYNQTANPVAAPAAAAPAHARARLVDVVG